MQEILKWLSEYSPAVVLLLVFGSALAFVLKLVTEKAISGEFDRYKREIELKLQTRSNFEERILIDRYTIIRDLEARIGRVATDLNRRRRGMTVKGLINAGDIVPLTEVFDLLALNRYLITETFHRLLLNQSQALINMANEADPEKLRGIDAQYLELLNDFHKAIDEMFGIEKISAHMTI